MKPLDTLILSFNNWSSPWTFYDFIYNSSALGEKDKELFQTIWTAALENENWLQFDLITGCKNAQSRLSSNFELCNEAILSVVRAASFEWK